MRRFALAAVPLALALAQAAPAAAAASARTAPRAAAAAAPAPPTTRAPAPVRAGGTLALALVRPLMLGGRPLALVGEPVRVRAVVSIYVPGETVLVRAYRGRRRLAARRLALRPVPGGGAFADLALAPRSSGAIRFTAVRPASARQLALVARPLRVTAYPSSARFGSRGPVVRLVQRQLAKLRFAVGQSHVYDGATGRALLAYRKTNGMARTGALGRRVLRRLLAGRGAFRPRYPRHGRHVEADLSRQVLALVSGGRPYRVFTMSSGKPSTPTVIGSFRFYSKTPGYNSEGMYFSNYFIRGYAVHGYATVPTYPASHGCLRVPIPNAVFIYRWIRLGQRIDVYP